MIDIYTILSKKSKNRKLFTKTEEYLFYVSNKHLLDKLNKFSFVTSGKLSDFDIIRINILLKAVINKNIIEQEIISLGQYKKVDTSKFISTLREKTLDLPYLQDDKSKIFIPIFSRALNHIYMKEPLKLLDYPYNELILDFKESMIDPFDVYGYDLYNSYFTRLVLIKIAPNKKEAAFYHYDTNTIYFINNQGRLDRKIVLFDKYIKHPVKSHMLERLTPVVDAYFAHDRSAFLQALSDNKFISNRMLSIIRKL